MSVQPLSQQIYQTYRIENEVPFLSTGGSNLVMPEGAEKISVSAKENKLEVTALVDPSRPNMKYPFCLRVAGFPLDWNEGSCVGSVGFFNDYFVGHFFKMVPNPSYHEHKRIIYKYPLKNEGDVQLKMPKGAQEISVFVRRKEPFLYAIVDPTRSPEKRAYFVSEEKSELKGKLLIGSFSLNNKEGLKFVFRKI